MTYIMKCDILLAVKDLKMKLRDWDSIGRTYQERIKGLENENMILKDKNEILQVGV